MGLVDDDRVVGIQIAVMRRLGQQDTVGHELDDAVLIQFLAKTHLVANHAAQWCIEFFRDPVRHGLRGNSAGLGTTNEPANTSTGLHAHLGQLGGFT